MLDLRVAPTPTDVAAIAAIDDRVLRNLAITQCYAELSEAMRARTGASADWCTFATWASRQAGSTIRGEDLIDRLQRKLGQSSWVLAPVSSVSRVLVRRGLFQPDTRLGRVVSALHTPLDAFGRASAAVAEGNLKVFAEIGREFARFLATVPVDADEQGPEFRAFASGLRPGPPPDGQDYLREAFAHYLQQRRESDPGARAAWVLLANLKIGLHEQTRLQPQITAAMDSPLVTAEDLGARGLHALIPGSRRWPSRLQGPLSTGIGWFGSRLRREAVTVTREVVTEAMMVLTLPNVVLALGRDLDMPVPPLLAGRYDFLDGFVREYDPCAPGGITCGADDWGDLRQRMHYIAHLFRACAQDPALLSPPFRPEQVSSIRAGRVPDGDL